MKKNRGAVIILVLFVLLLTGAFLVALLHFSGKMTGKVEEKDTTMFSAYTDAEALQEVPVMATEGSIGEPVEYARKGYIVDVNGSTVEEYQAYLETLKDAGFKKHSDNGEDAMEGNVMTTSFTKGDVTLTVSHAIKGEHTYISAGLNVPLSDHLIYKDEYTKDLPADAKTKVHMVELMAQGNSFVTQLKNGHFIIQDGGKGFDAPYLLDYLESLTPKGEKPVIEAWFITHPHDDHAGAMMKIATTPEYLNRIHVEGFYYYDLSDSMLSFLKLQPGGEVSRNITLYHKAFKTSEYEETPLYRPQFGQRLYFCDTTIDVCFTIEQCTKAALENFDLNDSSIWLMHNIEEQKFLVIGDSNFCAQNTAIFTLDEEYFDVDIYATPHHAINMYQEFNEVVKTDTLLYTSFLAGSIWQDGTWRQAESANEYARQNVKEYYHYGDGTLILTFPYKLGSVETLEPNEWVYNGGQDRRELITREWK